LILLSRRCRQRRDVGEEERKLDAGTALLGSRVLALMTGQIGVFA
jgi:hypothetical protein